MGVWTGVVAKTVQSIADILLKPAPLAVTGVPPAPDLGERATAGLTVKAPVVDDAVFPLAVEVTPIVYASADDPTPTRKTPEMTPADEIEQEL
jgi:hypothetical protein